MVTCNQASIEPRKNKVHFFSEVIKKDYIPLRLPLLSMIGTTIERIKILGVILEENRTWRGPIKTIKTKITKNIGILYKAR